MVRKIYVLIVFVLLHATLCIGDWRKVRYIQHDQKVTWEEARAYCRQQHADLVTITENNYFFSGSGWLGLHYDSSQNVWKWIRGGETAIYTNWKDDTPGTGKCAYKHAGELVWRARECTDTRDFICTPNTTILVKEMKTWEEAVQHCRSLEAIDTSRPAIDYQNHRYDLVSLLTTDDHIHAQEIAQEATTDELWTSLRFLSGWWMWLSGERVQMPTLPMCPAADLCGTLEKNGNQMYRRRDCQERRNFLCNNTKQQ